MGPYPRTVFFIAQESKMVKCIGDDVVEAITLDSIGDIIERLKDIIDDYEDGKYD